MRAVYSILTKICTRFSIAAVKIPAGKAAVEKNAVALVAMRACVVLCNARVVLKRQAVRTKNLVQEVKLERKILMLDEVRLNDIKSPWKNQDKRFLSINIFTVFGILEVTTLLAVSSHLL